jgi:hypothetical protein
VFAIWATFAILSIWVPAEALILVVGVLAGLSGVALGARGVGLSVLAVIVVAVGSELTSAHPLSTHEFLTSCALAIFLLAACGGLGYAGRVAFHHLAGKSASGKSTTIKSL